jgi:hypothetical protein
VLTQPVQVVFELQDWQFGMSMAQVTQVEPLRA